METYVVRVWAPAPDEPESPGGLRGEVEHPRTGHGASRSPAWTSWPTPCGLDRPTGRGRPLEVSTSIGSMPSAAGRSKPRTWA